MSIIDSNYRITEDDFLYNAYKKRESESSRNNAKYSINAFEKYCKDVFGKSRNDVIDEYFEDFVKNHNGRPGAILINRFVTWLEKSSISAGTISGYYSWIKKYLIDVGGLDFTERDLKLITLPYNDTDPEDSIAFSHEQIKIMIHHTNDFRRRCMFMVLKDTGLRDLEIMHIKKVHFDLDRNPYATLFIPKNIVKGKVGKRTSRLCDETTNMIKVLLKGLNDDDYVFRGNPGTAKRSQLNEIKWLTQNRQKLSFYDEMFSQRKPNSNHHKLTLHSFRRFCSVQTEIALRSEGMAHGYIGHKGYLSVYGNKSESEKDELFAEMEPRLTVLEDHIEESEIEAKIAAKYEAEAEQLRTDFQDQINDLKTKITVLTTMAGMDNFKP